MSKKKSFTSCFFLGGFQVIKQELGGGFKDFVFSSLSGEDSHFD